MFLNLSAKPITFVGIVELGFTLLLAMVGMYAQYVSKEV